MRSPMDSRCIHEEGRGARAIDLDRATGAEPHGSGRARSLRSVASTRSAAGARDPRGRQSRRRADPTSPSGKPARNGRATGARRARRGPARLTAGRPRPPHGEHDRWSAPADRRPIGGQKEKGADAIGAAPSRQSVVQSFRNDSVRMGLRGVEPLTSRLSGVRSNQLSYRPLPEHDKLVTPTRSGQPRRSLRPQWNPGC